MKKGIIYIELLIFVLVALFLWFRKNDATGAENVLVVKYISLGVWTVFGIIVAIVQFIFYKILSTR